MMNSTPHGACQDLFVYTHRNVFFLSFLQHGRLLCFLSGGPLLYACLALSDCLTYFLNGITNFAFSFQTP